MLAKKEVKITIEATPGGRRRGELKGRKLGVVIEEEK